jgi:predicted amidohydrolase
MRIAALPYHCQPLPDWDALYDHLAALIDPTDADLVVLPEYAAMQAAMVGALPTGGVHGWRDRAASAAAAWTDLCSHLAHDFDCTLLAGSGPEQTARGVVNRAWLCGPDGGLAHQDKLILTPYERNAMNLTRGEGLRLFDTGLGKIGVLICFDAEFPHLARSLAEAGADLILVPACTDFATGQTRVRQSARARAIENQCLVVHVPLIGDVPACEIIDTSTGRAGVFAPPDHGLPPDGILAQGDTDSPAPVIWEGDPRAIAAPRETGQVGNFAHWPEQFTVPEPLETVKLA